MTRQYANIFCAIWDDPDFVLLSAGAQRTYFMLVTQTEISACGSLALTLRRWSKTCTDSDLEVWLAELSDARFVLVDEDSEELLVRTFVKHDGGYKHAKRVMAVVASAKAIRSRVLRSAVSDELAKLNVSIDTASPFASQSSANTQAMGQGRSVVTEVGNQSTPQTAIPEGEPSPSDASDGPPSSMFCSKHPTGTEKACGPCGTAKQRYMAAQKALERRATDARRANRAAIDACPHCDDFGRRLDTATLKPIAVCAHGEAA